MDVHAALRDRNRADCRRRSERVQEVRIPAMLQGVGHTRPVGAEHLRSTRIVTLELMVVTPDLICASRVRFSGYCTAACIAPFTAMMRPAIDSISTRTLMKALPEMRRASRPRLITTLRR